MIEYHLMFLTCYVALNYVDCIDMVYIYCWGRRS